MSDYVNELNMLKLQEAEDKSIEFLEKYPHVLNNSKGLAKMAADRLATFEKEKSGNFGWLTAHYLFMLENQIRRLQELSKSEEFEPYATCKVWQDTIVQLECSLQQMKSSPDLQPCIRKHKNFLDEMEMEMANKKYQLPMNKKYQLPMNKKDSNEEDTDEKRMINLNN